MGIKFRGKTSTGNPAGSSIKERELEINLADGNLFTSSNGTDVIQLGEDIAGRLWDTSNSYSVGDIVTDTLNSRAYRCMVVPALVGTEPSADIYDDVAVTGSWTIVGLPVEETTIPQELKGRMVGTQGLKDDAQWQLALSTPSFLREDYTFVDDSEVNHILAGPFDTNGFTLDVPASTTVTIV